LNQSVKGDGQDLIYDLKDKFDCGNNLCSHEITLKLKIPENIKNLTINLNVPPYDWACCAGWNMDLNLNLK